MSKIANCGVFTGCCVFMISIAGVVLLALLLKSNGKEDVVISSLEQNLSSRGISAIARVSTTQCPAGSYPLLNNIFSGTVRKCLCQNISNGLYSFHNHNKNRCRVSTYTYRC